MSKSRKPKIAVLDFVEDGCDAGTGRQVAEEIMQRLRLSGIVQVAERSEWSRVGDNRTSRNSYYGHPGWAAGLMTLIGADGAVMGRVRQLSHGNRTITANVLDSNGISLASADGENTANLAKWLSSARWAKAISARPRPNVAAIEFVFGASLLLNIDQNSALHVDDRLRIERVLETVNDPYFDKEARVFDFLIAGAGEVEVAQIGVGVALARYSGNSCPKAGDRVTLSKI
jgi:hypothetical protein